METHFELELAHFIYSNELDNKEKDYGSFLFLIETFSASAQ
jgi:hypothetical protein